MSETIFHKGVSLQPLIVRGRSGYTGKFGVVYDADAGFSVITPRPIPPARRVQLRYFKDVMYPDILPTGERVELVRAGRLEPDDVTVAYIKGVMEKLREWYTGSGSRVAGIGDLFLRMAVFYRLYLLLLDSTTDYRAVIVVAGGGVEEGLDQDFALGIHGLVAVAKGRLPSVETGRADGVKVFLVPAPQEAYPNLRQKIGKLLKLYNMDWVISGDRLARARNALMEALDIIMAYLRREQEELTRKGLEELKELLGLEESLADAVKDVEAAAKELRREAREEHGVEVESRAVQVEEEEPI